MKFMEPITLADSFSDINVTFPQLSYSDIVAAFSKNDRPLIPVFDSLLIILFLYKISIK